MKKLFIFLTIISALMFAVILNVDSKEKGEKCISDCECGFGMQCVDGVCVKQKEFDHGSSGKAGDPCNIDADCIGSGKCVKNNFGKGYCSGN